MINKNVNILYLHYLINCHYIKKGKRVLLHSGYSAYILCDYFDETEPDPY